MTERRPIAARGSGWAQAAARWLATTSVTPNQISASSMLFAALALGCFWLTFPAPPGVAAALLIGAALFCQLRLVANLLDGMVALEGGKGGPTGPFWNEAPDRVADVLILAGLGLAAGPLWLGCLAGALAVGTAYIRELGRAEGLPADFCGPMAKPHRMAAVTAGCVAGAVEALLWGSTLALTITLWLVALGTAATGLRRALRLIRGLSLPREPGR
ncbi:CDP-alcohol phosphatidyltransferase family protein [Vannielia litorea]|uniref:Phosphatidylglycerophosphate synthase n=1 Tax=Vannielia litorea TaxID=1217970 RepID=A0A1N6ILI5_9RHOB|nr:CDP-alcohol phosphatidyltransferase family protein [Vannielia litorea]SIO32908.1 Phosphatidylglycerophosphate synthase [Vannielia litorea]